MAIFTGLAAAVATFNTWFAGLTAVQAFGVRIAAGLAFNALAKALAGNPDQPQGGIEGQLQQGADLSRRFILGRTATAGSLVYHNQWGGGSNQFYTRVTALSDLPVSGLAELWIDGELSGVDWENPDPEGKGYPILGLRNTATVTRERKIYQEGTDYIIGSEVYDDEVTTDLGWVRFYDGTQTAADSLLTGSVATEARPWDATDVGHGVAYAVTTFRVDKEKFQGLPQILFVVDGVPLYDWETEEVGTGDDLPGVQAHAILSGLSWGGQRLYGPQTPAAMVAAEWAAEIAKCRADVPGAETMTDAEKIEAFGSTAIPARYRSGLEVDVSRPVADVLEDIVSACNGRISHTGTRYRLQVGDPGTAVATLTDGDILSASGQSFAPFFPLAETVNAISATYPEPDEGWQMQDAPLLTNQDYEAEEGGRRLPTSVELTAVPYREQVQRLMKSALAEARRARRHSLTLPARYWALEVGDFLDWSSVRNGYDAKRMRVDGLSDLPNGDLVADLTEVDPADYDWSAASDFAVVTTGSVTGQPLPALELSGWALSPVRLRDGEGSARRPAILAEWTDPDRARVLGLRWQLRLAATGEVVGSGVIEDVEAEARVLPVAVLPATEYEGRAQILTRRRPSVWTDWIAVTTDDVRLSEDDLSPEVWDAISADATDIASVLLDDLATTRIDPIDTEITRINRRLTLKDIEQRSVSASLQKVDEHLAWAMEHLGQTDTMIRNAGIYVDEEDGTVRIAAAEYALQKASEVEIKADAANAEISLRVTYAEMNQAISEAVLDPTQIPIVDDLYLRVTNIEADFDGLTGAIALKSDTTTVNALEVRQTAAEAKIDSLEGTIVFKVDQAEFAAAETRLTTAEITLGNMDGASIRRTTADTRYLTREASVRDAETLQDLLDAYQKREAMKVDLAYAMEDIHARVNSDRTAMAKIATDLGASIDGNTALLNEEQKVRATETSALAKDVLTLQVTAGDQGAAITELNKVTADSESATARAVHQLQLDVSTVEDGVSINASALSGLTTRVTSAEGSIVSIAQDVTSLDSRMDAAEGGVSANSTALGQLTTRVTSAEGTITTQGQSITQLDSRLDDAEGDVAGLASATSSLNTRVTNAEGSISTTSSQVSSLSTTVGGHTSTLTEYGASIDGMMAEKTIKLNVNGHISGLVLRSELGENGAVVSEAAFVADMFAIVGPGDNPETPFTVYTTPTTVDGVTLPAGVYMKQANISTVRADRIKLDGLTLDSDGGSLTIKSAGVKTVHVGDNQISQVGSNSKGGDEDLPAASADQWTQVLTSGTRTWLGSKPLLVMATIHVSSSYAAVHVVCRIKVNGLVVYTAPKVAVSGTLWLPITLAYEAQSVAGSSAVTIEAKVTNDSGGTTTVLQGSTIAAFELKR